MRTSSNVCKQYGRMWERYLRGWQQAGLSLCLHESGSESCSARQGQPAHFSLDGTGLHIPLPSEAPAPLRQVLLEKRLASHTSQHHRTRCRPAVSTLTLASCSWAMPRKHCPTYNQVFIQTMTGVATMQRSTQLKGQSTASLQSEAYTAGRSTAGSIALHW